MKTLTLTPFADRLATWFFMLLLVLAAMCSPAFAQQNDDDDVEQSHVFPDTLTATVVKVVDGDTFYVDAPSLAAPVRVRLQNADTFEIKRIPSLAKQSQLADITEAQALAKGQEARTFAEKTLYGRTVFLRREPRDRSTDQFKRPLRLLTIDGKDFGVLLEERGLTAPWRFRAYRFQHDSSSTKQHRDEK